MIDFKKQEKEILDFWELCSADILSILFKELNCIVEKLSENV